MQVPHLRESKRRVLKSCILLNPMTKKSLSFLGELQGGFFSGGSFSGRKL